MYMLRLLFLAVIVLAVPVFGQVSINGFNDPRPDTLLWTAKEGASSLTLSLNTSDKVEGTGALDVKAKLGSYHPWGTYAQIGYTVPDSVTPLNWSISDSLSIWIKVKVAPTHPEYMLFRIQIGDKTSKNDPKEQYIWQDEVAIDAVTAGWVQIRIPLRERVSDGTTIPDNTGFVVAPSTWGGFTYNNHKLDRDKVVEWSIGMITSGWTDPANIPADSMEISFDGFARFGTRAVPVVLFNGKDFVAPVSASWAWGNGGVSVEQNSGPVAKSNAVKFVEGDAWGGWSGWGVDMAPTNMVGSWVKDSLHFKIKAEAGGDSTLRAQFESANGKRGIKFKPVRDNAWHSYTFALKDMTFDDGSPNFDASVVNKFGFMSDGHSILGKVDYFTDVWTGSPVFDVIPPDAPSGVVAIGGSSVNIVTWNDVPNEPGSTYSVYFSEAQWTTEEDPEVEDVRPMNLPLGQQSATHILRYPNVDHNVTCYYGVIAKDAAGNESPFAMGAPVTTLAKGVPTLAMAPPANFAADGDVTEWTASTIHPFVLSKQTGTAHVNSGGTITDDNDLSAKAYVAVDANYLYVAFDVVDDIVNSDSTGTDYQQDAPDMFIGLYDWRGRHHSGYSRGAKPDYHFRFSKNMIKIDNGGAVVMYQFPGGSKNPNYTWTEKGLEPGYTIEAKISLAELATKLTGNDAVFSRIEGMRIPLDFEINDRDAKSSGDLRDGMLCYSSNNDDNSYQDMWRWTYSWVGNKYRTTGVEQVGNVAQSYELGQNFPNPFNPTTEIRYSLKSSGKVTLKIYDMLGREIATLVNGFQEAGAYTARFSAADASLQLASGMYFYRLEAGSFVSTRKMLLLK